MKAGLPIFDHCEDMSLRGNGCMNEDENAKRLGLPGICNSTEDTIAARDSLLAIETGAKLHLCHCSTRGVAIMMKMLKEEGIQNVTAEVCPHHFILTSDDIERDDPNYKMNPPLRTEADRQKIIEGLIDGTIDLIATDHAPHSAEEKSKPVTEAPSGIIGLETSLALGITSLVKPGHLSMLELLEKMTINPARLYHMPYGTISEVLLQILSSLILTKNGYHANMHQSHQTHLLPAWN